MGLAALRENQLIRIGGRLLKLAGRLSAREWQLVDVGTGFLDRVSDDSLWSSFGKNELTFVSDADPPLRSDDAKLELLLTEQARAAPILATDDNARLHAARRFKYVQATTGLTLEQITRCAKDLWEGIGWPSRPPHANTIRNWQLKAQNSCDPISALVDRHDRKGRRGERYCAEEMDLLREIRDKEFLKMNPRIRVSEAVRRARDKVHLRNAQNPPSERWQLPGRRAFQRVVNELPEAEVFARRYGSDAALTRYRTSLGGRKAEKPLDRCEIDHTSLSVILLDDDFQPWGRASDTIAVDACTRMPTGVYWGAEVPSVVALGRCLRNSVMPKSEFMKHFPSVSGTWNAFGVAAAYNVDNGLEEWAVALQNAMSELGGAVLEFGARKSPWHKPYVERYFRNQDLGFLQNLPGATMENVLQRCKFDPKKDFLIRRSAFDQLRMKWMIDVYLNESQARLGNRSPNEQWSELIQGVDQFVPTRTVMLHRLFLRRVPERILDHEGIEFDCLMYNSTDLGALRSQRGPTLSVELYVSDEDLGHIHVVVPNSDIWIRVPCLDLHYAKGLTRWQHQKCKAMRRALKSDGRELSLAQAREEIRSAIRHELKEFRQAQRKRRSRFTESVVNTYWAMEDGDLTPQADAAPAGPDRIRGRNPAAVIRERSQPTPILKSFIAETGRSPK